MAPSQNEPTASCTSSTDRSSSREPVHAGAGASAIADHMCVTRQIVPNMLTAIA